MLSGGVLDNPADVARFRGAVRPEDHPEGWFAANVDAPLLIIAHSNKDAYLDRYALPDKGFTDRSDAWWPAPYWDIDTGFASLLMLLTAAAETVHRGRWNQPDNCAQAF
jgi:hypothetical protein